MTYEWTRPPLFVCDQRRSEQTRALYVATNDIVRAMRATNSPVSYSQSGRALLPPFTVGVSIYMHLRTVEALSGSTVIAGPCEADRSRGG